MTTRTLALNDRLYEYLLGVSLRESDTQRRLREETSRDRLSNMQIAPEQGQFMGLLMQLMDVTKALEIGTYTGYSALCMASAMPSQGRLICCDISEEWTTVARRYWLQAGVAHKIDLRLAPALDTLDALLSGGQAGGFDFAFIDADKQNYVAYYERCLALLRQGGLVAVDNTLWNGSVADSRINEPDTESIREFNRRLRHDTRIALSLVPIGDGLTLARKR